MREYVVNEYIKCDLCGHGMASETNGTTVHHAYTSNATCFEGVVKVSAIICGRELTCICNDCRKAILQRALDDIGNMA